MPARAPIGWLDAPPGGGFATRAFVLHERLNSSWFKTRWRERIPDGCRMTAKNTRTFRGLRLYSFWWFGARRAS